MSLLTQQVGFGVQSKQSSARGFIPLLREKDNEFKVLALETLLGIVDTQWSEISEYINQMQKQIYFQNYSSQIYSEQLQDDPHFPQRELAAYLCSKVYYHLGDQDEALNLALRSGKYFNLEYIDSLSMSLRIRNQFNECLTWHCIEQYIKHQQENNHQQFPPAKEQMIIKILTSSCSQGNQLSAIGVSLDCRRIDLVEQILNNWNNPQRMMAVLQLVHTVPKGEFREKVLRMCVDLIYAEAKQGQIGNEEWGHFVGVLVQLGEVSRVAEVIWTLLGQNTFKLEHGDSISLAYQLSLDLADNQKPQFTQQLIASLPIDASLSKQRAQLVRVLSGEVQRKAYFHYLKEHSQTDPQILSNIKSATDPKFSVPHGAALMAHAITQTGTQNSSFLKDNMEWATKCNYWQRFTATATLGMIHKGNYEDANGILSSYLPGAQNQQANIFENGGALYALGLMNTGNQNEDAIQKLTSAIRDPLLNKNEQIVHGACLGLGLVGFASESEQISNLLKEVLFKNESVYGESAALGLGLVFAGSHSEELTTECLNFCSQTDKEKIIRSLGMAIASINWGQEDKVDGLCEQMLKDSEVFVRYGGCVTLGMAYVGTGSNKVVKRLLQIAVEDVSDDVRRVAVISLAFVLYQNYEQIPKVMRLLILSYNPHIRYGTALALGIACAGTMYSEAIKQRFNSNYALYMLEPMLQDNVDFVRQGAMIGLSLVLMQATGNCEPKIDQFRKQLSEIQGKKHETVLAKLGVFMSQGILDAGGKNLVSQMSSRQGFAKLEPCVGMLYFINYWYWFPCVPFLSLNLQPAALIGLNQNLDIVKNFSVQCNCKQSLFGYPAHLKPDEKKVLEKKTVKLSTSNKVKARQSKKEAERQDMAESSVHEEAQVLEHQQSQLSMNREQSQLVDDGKMKVKGQTPFQKPVEPVKKEEPAQHLLENPCRILEKQRKYIQFVEGRYYPLFKERKTGLVILIDSAPEEKQDVIALADKPKFSGEGQPLISQALQPAQQEQEVHPPEEFLFDEALQNSQK